MATVVTTCSLTPLDDSEFRSIMEDLIARGLATPADIPEGLVTLRHTGAGGPDLTVTCSIETYSLEFAHAHAFGLRRWRHVTVSVAGQLQARLADQRAIGRERGPGERSPVPLPGWYDLTHVVYGHPELGFNPGFAVYQILPPPDAPYLNIAEALHLRQPA